MYKPVDTLLPASSSHLNLIFSELKSIVWMGFNRVEAHPPTLLLPYNTYEPLNLP